MWLGLSVCVWGGGKVRVRNMGKVRVRNMHACVGGGQDYGWEYRVCVWGFGTWVRIP